MTSTWSDVDGVATGCTFLFFCSFLSRGLGLAAPWPPVFNVSSQEAPECCQGNESHGSTKRIITHAWLVFFWGGQGAHTLHNKACFSASVQSLLAFGGSLTLTLPLSRNAT